MSIDYKRRLLLAGAAVSCLGASIAVNGAQAQKGIVKVVAKKFDFTPDKIHLEKNVPVTLELTTLDVVMGFNLPGFDLRTDILPGTTARIRFTPDKTGNFPFHCDIFCGDGHESMSGVLTVT